MSDEPIRLQPQSVNDRMLAEFDKRAAKVRAFIVEHPRAGFVMAAYAREGAKETHHKAHFFLHDPMDAYWLPQFFAAEISRLRDDGADDDD